MLACFLIGPSAASANSIGCWGHVSPAPTNQRDLTYLFQCSEPVRGFSIISNLDVGEFGTEALVLDPSSKEPVSGQSFGCEGSIPGDGFGCKGTSQDPNLVTGTFAIDQARCVKRRNRLRAWVVVIDLSGVASDPKRLVVPQRCPKVSKQRRHR